MDDQRDRDHQGGKTPIDTLIFEPTTGPHIVVERVPSSDTLLSVVQSVFQKLNINWHHVANPAVSLDGGVLDLSRTIEQLGLHNGDRLLLSWVPQNGNGGGQLAASISFDLSGLPGQSALFEIDRRFLDRTLDVLRRAADTNSEGCCIWAGVPIGDDGWRVLDVVIPTVRSSAVHLEWDLDEVGKVSRTLREKGLIAVAQVHSHLGRAFHSKTDDRHPFSIWPNFISIVFPNGGHGQAGVENAAVYQHIGGLQWRSWGERERNDRLVIADMFDRSRCFEDTVRAVKERRRIAIVLPEDLANVRDAQICLYSVVNCLVRATDRYQIDLRIPSVDSQLEFCPGNLKAAIRGLAASIDPVRTYSEVTASVPYDLELSIGEGPSLGAAHHIYTANDGWLCWAGTGITPVSNQFEHENPIAALMSGAFAAAQAYALIESVSVPVEPVRGWSLLSLSADGTNPPFPQAFNGDTFIQAGVGAFGQAFHLALGMLRDPSFRCTCFDGETLELTNNNRYALLSYRDHGSKVAAVSNFWHGRSAVEVEPHPGDIEQLSSNLSESLLITAMDRPDGKAFLAGRSIRTILNGGTSDHSFGITRHGSSRPTGACMGCIAGRIDALERRRREGTISFVSMAGGILLAAEYIKECCFPEFKTNAFTASIFHPSLARPYDLRPNPSCLWCSTAA